MQTFGYLLLIFVSLQWDFVDNSLEINKGMPLRQGVERHLKTFFEEKANLRKNRLRDLKTFRKALKSWIESLRRFNVCRLSSAQKKYLCQSILRTDRYDHKNLDMDLTPECERHKVSFADEEKDEQKKDRGKQILKMFPCRLVANLKKVYYISGTGEKKPSVYFFIQEIKNEKPGPIYVDAHVTNIDMEELEEVRHIEKHPRQYTWLGSTEDKRIHPLGFNDNF